MTDRFDAAFEAFVAPARPRAQLWRIPAVFVVTAAVTFAVMLGIQLGAEAIHPEMIFEIMRGSTPRGVMLFLAAFLGIHFGLWLGVGIFHRRAYRSLFGPPGAPLGRNFGFGVLFALGLIFAPFVLAPLDAALFPGEFSPPHYTGIGETWAIWAAPALVAILVQSAAEEVFFRGYLLQQLGARFRSPWIWAVLPAAIFGALHYNPATFGANTWLHMVHTAVVGTLLALVTARTGNLGAAIGLHFANNAVGFLLFSMKGYQDGVALFVYDFDLKGAYVAYGLAVQTAVTIAGYALWLRWMQRRHARLQTGPA